MEYFFIFGVRVKNSKGGPICTSLWHISINLQNSKKKSGHKRVSLLKKLSLKVFSSLPVLKTPYCFKILKHFFI